jgi:hypothetical protein
MALLCACAAVAQNWDVNSIPPGLIEGNVNGEYVVKDIAADQNSNLYVTGYYKGTFNGVASNGNSNDLFVAKYNSGHVLQWALCLGGSGDDGATAISSNTTGGLIYVGGYIEGSVTVTTIGGSFTLNTPGRRGFFMRLSTFGTINWVQQLEGSNGSYHCEISDIAVDRSFPNRVAISGWSNQNTVFRRSLPNTTANAGGPFTITRPGNYLNGFVAGYTDAGRPLWATKITDNTLYDGSSAASVCVVNRPGDNFAYVTGQLHGSLSFGSTSYNTNGGTWSYLAKINLLNGQYVWVDDIQHDGISEGLACELDYTTVPATPHIGGYFKDLYPLVFSSTVSVNGFGACSFDAFYAKYDPAGYCLWANRAGTDKDDYVTHLKVSLDGQGHLYGMGNTGGNFAFGARTVVVPDNLSSVFITKHDGNGGQWWVDYLHEPCSGGNQLAGGLALGPQGLVVAGSTNSEIEFNANFPSMEVRRSPSGSNTASFYGMHYPDMRIANAGLSLVSRTPTSITVSFAAFPPPIGSRLYYRPKRTSDHCIDTTTWILHGTFIGPIPIAPVTLNLPNGPYEIGVQHGSGLSPNSLCEIGGSLNFSTILVPRQQQPSPTPTPPKTGGITAYPNPTTGSISISGHLQKASAVTLSLADAQGRPVKQWPPLQLPAGRFVQRADLGGLAAGTYLLTVKTAEGQHTQKIVKAGK